MTTKPRIWLITGCATGFGALLAQTLLDRGELVAATDRDGAALGHLRAGDAENLLALAMDVTDDASVQAGVRAAVERFGRVDVLVNNAGLGMGGPFEEVDMREARRLFDVNILGLMAVTQAALPHMRAGGGGRIINISSDSGAVGFPFQNVYTATKFAVEGFSESLLHEVYPFGIHVSLIEPCGLFKTNMPAGAIREAQGRLSPDSPYYARASALASEMGAAMEHASDPRVVVEAILEVADADPPPLRRRAGPPDRTGLVAMKKQLSDEEFIKLIRGATGSDRPAQHKASAGRATAGELIVRTLKREGVSHVFTIVGGHNYDIVEAARAEGLRVVDVRHEAQAAHMADAWARFTGTPALLTVDAAPGLTNAVPGIEIAHEAQVPMLIVNAQGSLAGRDIGVMQAIDEVRLLRPITKWQRTCFDARRLPEYTAMALRQALSGRPGPVFLDMPMEVMHAHVEADDAPIPEKFRTTARAYGDPALVRAALDLLSGAKRPMVIAGSGCWWSGAGEELRAFVETSGIPVLTRNLARGLVPDDHPLCVGFMPSGAFGADAYLIIGTRLDWTIGYGRFPLFDLNCKAIQVDTHAESIGRNRPIDVGIVGDARAVLRQLNDALPDYPMRMDYDWPARAKGSLMALREETARGAGLDRRAPDRPMHSIQLVRELGACLDRDAITVIDGGYIAAFGIQYLDALAPGGITWVGSTGHLGVGVAYANAAKLAHPGRRVVALMGDGSFGLCGMEFDTAVRHGLPIVVVVANDEGWGEIRDGQRRRYGDAGVVGSQLGLTRYDEMARALGGHGEFVERLEDLRPALRRAFESGKPAIVNVHTDPEQHSTTVSGMPWIVE